MRMQILGYDPLGGIFGLGKFGMGPIRDFPLDGQTARETSCNGQTGQHTGIDEQSVALLSLAKSMCKYFHLRLFLVRRRHLAPR